jgi:hypothetical protein
MYQRYKPYNLWTLLYPIAWVDNDADTWYNIDLPETVQVCSGHLFFFFDTEYFLFTGNLFYYIIILFLGRRNDFVLVWEN